MRIVILFAVLLIHCSNSFAQWDYTTYAPKIFYNSGNVGIGVSSPNFKLSLYANENQTTLGGNTQSVIRLMNNYAEAFGRRSEIQFGLGQSANETLAVIAAEYTSWSGDVGGDLLFGTSPTNSTSVLERMRINSSGNVGVGTNNPQFKLDVAGQIASYITYLDNPVDADNGYVRSNFGSNVYWDTTDNFWKVRQIGANDFAALIHTNGNGFAFVTAPSDGNVAKSLTNSQFFSYERLRIDANGNVGIGTSSPLAKLSLRTSTATQGLIISNCDVTGGQSHFGMTTADQPRIGLAQESYLNTYNDGKWNFNSSNTNGGTTLPISFNTNGVSRIFIKADGNIGIGTTSPGGFKLAVNGKIWSQEVNVAMTNPGPDYVFEKDYDLLPLSEIETYINQYKHLPEVPSAKQMEEEGLNLKEMNLILLKKVEELTLHLIEMQKQNENQQKEIDHLKKFQKNEK